MFGRAKVSANSFKKKALGLQPEKVNLGLWLIISLLCE
jgi:hypothetical protein